MKDDSPIETLAACFWSAIHRDLPAHDGKRPRPYDCEVFAMFPQTWGDTSLGFGGVGGQAMTMAYTTIITDGAVFAVYFGQRFAYLIGRERINLDAFRRDVANRDMAEVCKASRYRITSAKVVGP